MTIFWDTIARAAGADDFQEELTLALLSLDAAQRASFETQWLDAYRALGTEALSEAVRTLWGGCGDDGFMDFKSWILTRGQALWGAVVADPMAALQPWANPMGFPPMFEAAISTPLDNVKTAGGLTAAEYRRWQALRDKAEPSAEDADAAVAVLQASEALAVLADGVLRRYFAGLMLPEVLLAHGETDHPVAVQWVDGLTRRKPGLALLAQLTRDDAPAVRRAAEQHVLLGAARSARMAFRALKGIESELVIPVVLAAAGRAAVVPGHLAAGSAVLGRLAIHHMMVSSRERPWRWILQLGHSGSPDAQRWLVWSALRGDYLNRELCYGALATCGHPLATPEILKTAVEDHLLSAAALLREVPDAALIAVIADAVPRMKDWEVAERCWEEAARLLARRPVQPATLAALRAVGGSAQRRLLAAWALAMLGEGDGEALLVAALQAYVDDREHRGAVWEVDLITALGRIASTAALPVMKAQAEAKPYPRLLLALERIEPGVWQDALSAATPELLERLYEEQSMWEDGLITEQERDRTRALAREVMAILNTEDPGAASLRAHPGVGGDESQ